MPAFVKNPKFIVGTLVVLWVAYILYENFRLEPIQIKLIPFVATIQFRVSAVIIGSAIFGALATLLVQFFWRNRAKNGSSPTSVSTRTVA